MNLPSIQSRLQQSRRQLHQQWLTTSSQWRDEKRDQFEHEYWQPVESQIANTLVEMERLSQVIVQVRQIVR